ncbi:MAG: hypothetical protein H8E03_00715 [Pelagibacteraceae bacterium]|nr:hypothetical protein [Pelagibacteraceae bacterium]
MASRFLSQRDRNFFETVNKELLGSPRDSRDGIINTFVKLFRLSVENTSTNLYGEAAAGKIYLPGVQLPSLIEADDFDFNTDEFGPDLRQSATFSFERDYLVALPLVISIGDIVDWNYAHWEITSLNENQLLGGQQDSNFSVRCTGFLVRKSNLQIERIRSN